MDIIKIIIIIVIIIHVLKSSTSQEVWSLSKKRFLVMKTHDLILIIGCGLQLLLFRMEHFDCLMTGTWALVQNKAFEKAPNKISL